MVTLPKGPRNRRGAATVEMAVALPVFFLLILGMILFGHMYMINNLLQIACRSGARLGAVEGVTTAEVQNRVFEILSSTVPQEALVLYVKDASAFDLSDTPPQTASEFAALPDVEVADLEARDMFLVRATVDYGSIALLPAPFVNNIMLVGQTISRHE